MTPGSAPNCIISINGVIQEPAVAYTVSGSTITFTAAPATGATFFGVVVGVLNANTYDAGSVVSGTLPDARLSAWFTNAKAGQIAFPATQNASSDVNTLDDYEEGTWTPADGSGAGLIFTSVVGAYIKIGKLVIVWSQFIYPSTASGANAIISGLPFTTGSPGGNIYGAVTVYTTLTTYLGAIAAAGGTTINMTTQAGTFYTNAQLSLLQFRLYITYQAAA